MNGSDNMDESRYEIEDYLDKIGIDADRFYPRIRQFLDRSRFHYRRLLIRDRIAAHIDPGLAPASPAGQKKVWEEVVRVIRVDKATLTRWKSGETDPPWEQLFKYFDHTDCPCEDLPIMDRSAAIRLAIARTLTYILVFPWPRVPDSGKVPEALSRCWQIASNHKYYQRFHDINQHLLDSMIVSVPQVSVKADAIGAIRRRMERRPRQSDLLYWPFAIFKLATFSKRNSLDSYDNTFKGLWQDNKREILWGLADEQ